MGKRLEALRDWMSENCREDLPLSALRPSDSDDWADWAEYEEQSEALAALDMRLTANAFVPVSGPATGPLVHFTHDWPGISKDGLRGVSDMTALGLTMGEEKDPNGFCFAYQADGDDAADALEPEDLGDGEFGSGYGDVAIVFVAEYILARHRGDGDIQAIFEASAFNKEDCIVLLRDDDPDEADFPARERIEWRIMSGDATEGDRLCWDDAIEEALRLLSPDDQEARLSPM